MIPEAIEAADILREQRVAVNVLNMTSPRRLFEAWQTMQQFPDTRKVAGKFLLRLTG